VPGICITVRCVSNHQNLVRFDEAGELFVPGIFKWYLEDFAVSPEQVLINLAVSPAGSPPSAVGDSNGRRNTQ
jgi:hypothetical protein